MSQKEIDEYLDTSIGGNTKLLQDLLRSLHKERDSLEKQVDFLSPYHGPFQLFPKNPRIFLLSSQLSGVGLLDEGSEWLTVVTEVQSTIAELETLHSNATAITQQVHGETTIVTIVFKHTLSYSDGECRLKLNRISYSLFIM